MTFFDKKTEVMQIEMTPYGRYLYSIGKFKPHSYEFVDDDIQYKVGGETQESSHNRIVNETPRKKPNANFQTKHYRILPDEHIENKRETLNIMDQKNPSERVLGKSSYSSNKTPSFEVSLLEGEISGSDVTKNINGSGSHVFISQIDIDYKIFLNKRSEIEEPRTGYEVATQVYDGEYLEINYDNKLLLIKEINSLYEKENFEIEVFKVDTANNDLLTPLKMRPKNNIVKDDMLDFEKQDPLSTEGLPQAPLLGAGHLSDVRSIDGSFVEYFFDIIVDEDISNSELCGHKDKIKVNSIFLDEEIECSDVRTDRFNLYDSDVNPDDLEDCD